jgi:hypothetical protein
MVSIAAGDERRPARSAKISGRHRAASIYGAIITAAIIAASGDELPTVPLVVAVVVTLIVYWVAEEYAEVIGEQAEGGRLPTWASIRGMLASTWPMVTASYAPLLALVLAHLVGASGPTAANVGLGIAIAALTFHGWSAGRAAQLHGHRLVLATSVAAALGVVMILLKDVVLIHLH